jgi:hypothetical protein
VSRRGRRRVLKGIIRKMRFLAEGPSIPDELLESRDQGNVIFLCGAGLSMPAGLPSFARLTRQVVDQLGAPEDSASQTLLTRIERGGVIDAPYDQVFQNLKYEYGVHYIDQLVSDLLVLGPAPTVQNHATILKLSRSAAGHAQVVTTNFDLLFERTDPTLKRTVAPALPDLTTGMPLEGLVYLHGRQPDGPTRASPLVLASADFGRAYLSEGWATTFVANLLRYYTIVLLGYSANDAPVRYLLQGIHARAEERRTRIYAFDRGSRIWCKVAGAIGAWPSFRTVGRIRRAPPCGTLCVRGRAEQTTSMAGGSRLAVSRHGDPQS